MPRKTRPLVRAMGRALVFLVPVLIALVVVGWMNVRPTVTAQDRAEVAVPVRVLTVIPETISGQVEGFGRVATARTWSGVAEVEGRLVSYDDRLQVGAMVKAGDLMFEIDTRDYEIAVAQREADVARAQADITAQKVNAANNQASLDVERQILAIYQADRDRIANLVAGGSVAATQLETADRTLLSQQSAVTSLEASLALAEADQASAEAALAKAQADLERAQRDLGRTRVVSPIDGRVTLRGASAMEYVRPGDVLVTIDAVDTVEVEAAFQPADLVQLIGTVDAAELAGLSGAAVPPPDVAATFGRLLRAEVTGQVGKGASDVSWPATISRITGQIDAETGAIGLVVQVENPTDRGGDPRRPPLVPGAFVTVTISGPSQRDTMLVPDRALHHEADTTFLFVADADDRLRRSDVVIGATFGDRLAIASGLSDGDRVVLSRPIPATEGLLLDVTPDRMPRP
ncbi:MAG: efflux RND transporter periplasmic adaptor subunit [Alphaproteobacteria bacterium]|nr:efflux RND transporter periplasmic adaptor subunit [Alphaproteobacteria bacterium]